MKNLLIIAFVIHQLMNPLSAKETVLLSESFELDEELFGLGVERSTLFPASGVYHLKFSMGSSGTAYYLNKNSTCFTANHNYVLSAYIAVAKGVRKGEIKVFVGDNLVATENFNDYKILKSFYTQVVIGFQVDKNINEQLRIEFIPTDGNGSNWEVYLDDLLVIDTDAVPAARPASTTPLSNLNDLRYDAISEVMLNGQPVMQEQCLTADGYSFLPQIIWLESNHLRFDIGVNNAVGKFQLAVWLDVNRDGFFDPSEMVAHYYDVQPGAQTFVDINSIEGLEQGVYTSRIRLLSQDVVPDAYIGNCWGDTKDLMFNLPENQTSTLDQPCFQNDGESIYCDMLGNSVGDLAKAITGIYIERRGDCIRKIYIRQNK